MTTKVTEKTVYKKTVAVFKDIKDVSPAELLLRIIPDAYQELGDKYKVCLDTVENYGGKAKIKQKISGEELKVSIRFMFVNYEQFLKFTEIVEKYEFGVVC